MWEKYFNDASFPPRLFNQNEASTHYIFAIYN